MGWLNFEEDSGYYFKDTFIVKKILYLTFYFEPDLCAGSFRNSPLIKELSRQIEGKAIMDVVTTLPNRYSTYQTDAPQYESRGNYDVYRISIPKHQSGMKDQVLSFREYYLKTKQHIAGKRYDLVVASSSRLFTAYLGYKIAKRMGAPLYLDIRDIFTDTMKDVLQNRVVKAFSMPILNRIEQRVFNYAKHINLISGGFKSYFDKYNKPRYTTFPNGIDDIFLNLPLSVSSNSNPMVITYAGNFGEGQGLHKIVPEAARLLGDDYKFLLIGDGGAKQKLLNEIEKQDVKNVEIHPPVKRDHLLEIYSDSDFLFLHLNDYDAFKKVLPSKIFELGAYDKPIIAGVVGFANQFIEENITNKILFLPGDVNSMVSRLKAYTYKNVDRKVFKEKYKRANINREMAKSILQYL